MAFGLVDFLQTLPSKANAKQRNPNQRPTPDQFSVMKNGFWKFYVSVMAMHSSCRRLVGEFSRPAAGTGFGHTTQEFDLVLESRSEWAHIWIWSGEGVESNSSHPVTQKFWEMMDPPLNPPLESVASHSAHNGRD